MRIRCLLVPVTPHAIISTVPPPSPRGPVQQANCQCEQPDKDQHSDRYSPLVFSHLVSLSSTVEFSRGSRGSNDGGPFSPSLLRLIHCRARPQPHNAVGTNPTRGSFKMDTERVRPVAEKHRAALDRIVALKAERDAVTQAAGRQRKFQSARHRTVEFARPGAEGILRSLQRSLRDTAAVLRRVSRQDHPQGTDAWRFADPRAQPRL